MNRRQYSEKHIRRVKLFERKFTRPVYNAIRKPMLGVADTLRSEGIEAAMQATNRVIIVEGVGSIVQDIYKQVGVWAASRSLREINSSAKEQKAGFGFNEEWIRDILEYFRLYLLNRAVLPISETTRKDIMEILTRGQEEGWGIDRMAFELERVDLPLARARTIVRTEIAKAQFYGTELGRRSSIYESVTTWIAANDHRTRHSHRDVDGDVVKEGEKFRVPIYRGDLQVGSELMKGPGDPEATAGNVINCRCTRATVAARDENGRPIKKVANSRISVILPQQNVVRLPVITI